jgi:GntR family transcriptional regulator, rspAB operon transcriptional repressor
LSGAGKPVGRGARTESTYRQVRDAILRGEYQFGDVLAEDELAARVGASRTPVRQALQLLLQEGLVEVGPRRQLIVRGVTPDLREEILLVREALEGLAVRRACDVMTLDEMDYLRLLLMRQRRAAEAELEDEFTDLDEEFHLRIAEGARLPLLHRFLAQIRGFVRLTRVQVKRPASHMFDVFAEHEAIVDALEQRDVDAALEALTTHLHTWSYDEGEERVALADPDPPEEGA